MVLTTSNFIQSVKDGLSVDLSTMGIQSFLPKRLALLQLFDKNRIIPMHSGFTHHQTVNQIDDSFETGFTVAEGDEMEAVTYSQKAIKVDLQKQARFHKYSDITFNYAKHDSMEKVYDDADQDGYYVNQGLESTLANKLKGECDSYNYINGSTLDGTTGVSNLSLADLKIQVTTLESRNAIRFVKRIQATTQVSTAGVPDSYILVIPLSASEYLKENVTGFVGIQSQPGDTNLNTLYTEIGHYPNLNIRVITSNNSTINKPDVNGLYRTYLMSKGVFDVVQASPIVDVMSNFYGVDRTEIVEMLSGYGSSVMTIIPTFIMKETPIDLTNPIFQVAYMCSMFFYLSFLIKRPESGIVGKFIQN